MTPEREFDLVLMGATGFTGQLVAAELVARMPAAGRWALAGRDEERLHEVARELGVPDLPVLVADSKDRRSLDALAASTRVVASTVGPYLKYGDALVGACASAGTDYVDLTGEPEFVDKCWLRYHREAQRTGARLVHACGFDSVPHDLGVQFLVEQLTAKVGEEKPIRARGVVRASAQFSGGTYASAVNTFARGRAAKKVARERKELEARPEGRRVRGAGGRPHRDPVLGYWLLPLPTIDPQVVLRSARALPGYGPEFSYSHWAGTKTLRWAVSGAVGVMALATAAQVPLLKTWLASRVAPGTGPDPERRANSWFTVDLVGESDGETVRVKVSGGDPGYTETSRMLSQAALCLAFDDLPETSGQVTTAVAMGPALRARLVATGMRFDVVE